MKRCIALVLALVLCLSAASALAAQDARLEKVEYKGFGIVELEFTWDCSWVDTATFALSDGSGADLPYQIVGGEAENCFLRAENITDGSPVTLDFTLGSTAQTLTFDAVTGTEYYVRNDDTLNPRIENDRCDFCGQSGHDEDYCPERIDASQIPSDIDQLARMFDIDRCERCGGIGHDDDHCPNR